MSKRKVRCIKRVQWDDWRNTVTVAMPGQVCEVSDVAPEHYPRVCIGTDNGCGFSMDAECTVCTRQPSVILHTESGVEDFAPLDCFEEL